MRRSTVVRLGITISMLAVAFVLPNPARAGTVVVPAAGDASVVSADEDENLGSESALISDRDPETHALLRFDVGALDGAVVDARLRLWVLDSTSNGPKVWLTNPFNEGDVTWDTRPALVRQLADLGSVSSGTWIEVDVTGAVVTGVPIGLALVPDSSNGADFVSSEGTSSRRPQLVVQTAVDSSSSTTVTDTTGGTTTVTDGTTTVTNGTTTVTNGTTTAPPTTTVPNLPPGGPFAPSADTYIADATPDTSFGTRTTVLSDADPRLRGLLSFTVPAPPEDDSRYVLRLWATNGSSNGPKVFTTGSFVENSVTWRNAPPLGSQVADIGTVTSSRWIEYDVTSAFNGPGTYQFALVPDVTDGADFTSREGSSSSRPQLVVRDGSQVTTTTAAATTTTTTTTTTSPPSGDTFQVGLIGDTGYEHPAQDEAMEDTVADMNRLNMTFGMHVGDIWGGGDSCSDSEYTRVKSTFQDFEGAFVYMPGDNEWKDCSESSSGRLSKVRSTFFPNSNSLGDNPISLTRQSGQPENTRWDYHGIVFATFNEPGSSGATGTMQSNNVSWLNAAFDRAESINAAGVMVLWQDNPFRPSGGALYRALEDRTEEFGRPVALIHGDTHQFHVDQPWSDLDNFTRVEVFGGSDDGEWVRGTINPSDPDVFSFVRERP